MLIYSYIFILCLLKSYSILDIFQQTHYNIKTFINYSIRHFKYRVIELVYLFIIIFVHFKIQVYLYLLLITIIEIISYKPKRVKLKITPRIIRLMFLYVLLSILVSYFYYSFIFIDFLCVIIFLIAQLIECLLSHKYVIRAENKLKHFKGTIIGITGSYGKTTTKNYIATIIDDLNVFKTEKSYNTLLGLSKSINLNNLEIYDNLILEFGASKVGDIKQLMHYFKPNIGIITSIGYMHLNSFKSLDNIIKEKFNIIEELDRDGLAILNYEDFNIRNYKIKNSVYVISYGINYGEFRVNKENKKVSIYHNSDLLFTFTSDLTYIDLLDLMPGIIIGLIKGMKFNNICMKIKNVKRPLNRKDIKLVNNKTIIDDSFNSNLNGALNGLSLLNTYNNRKILITSGFVENDKIIKSLYKTYSKKINSLNIETYVVKTYNTKYLFRLLNNAKMINNLNKLLKELINEKDDLTILIENDVSDVYL